MSQADGSKPSSSASATARTPLLAHSTLSEGTACCSRMCHLSSSSSERFCGSDGAGPGPALVARH